MQNRQENSGMAGFFKKGLKLITPSVPYQPSEGSRNSLLASTVIQTLQQSVALSTDNDQITTAIAGFPQIMLSLFVLCRYDTNLVDKFMATLLVICSLGVFGTASTLFFEEENCTDNSALLCKFFLYFRILYGAILSVCMTLTEASKAQAPTITVPTPTPEKESDTEENLEEEQEEKDSPGM